MGWSLWSNLQMDTTRSRTPGRGFAHVAVDWLLEAVGLHLGHKFRRIHLTSLGAIPSQVPFVSLTLYGHLARALTPATRFAAICSS